MFVSLSLTLPVALLEREREKERVGSEYNDEIDIRYIFHF